jgi:prepilin-type N-terminal cleavage/methylation domain-containing protein
MVDTKRLRLISIMIDQWHKYKPGFSLAELLIALAIAAMLLVAVAVAFNASATNYQQNEDIFKVVNSARQALCRITRASANAVSMRTERRMHFYRRRDIHIDITAAIISCI